MKNVLVLTDFKTASLQCIPYLLESFPSEKLNIILFHAFSFSDSIIDLLMLSQRQKDYKSIGDTFRNAVSTIKEQNAARIQSIQIECFYGSTLAIFKNFLEANKIHLICHTENYRFSPVNKYSVNLERIVQRCGIEVLAAPVFSVSEASNRALHTILDEMELGVGEI